MKSTETVSDSQIVEAAKATIKKFRSAADEYKDGKDGLLGMFVGEVMKSLKGQADPHLVNGFMKRELDNLTPFEKSAAEKATLKELKAQYKRQLR